MDELWLYGKWCKEKLFLQIQSIGIVYQNIENMIIVPITKGMEIIISIQVFLISRMNFHYKENICAISQITLIMRKMVERKAFFANPKHQYIIYPDVENLIVVPITKEMEIIMGI